jgi:phospholipid/cholesterol/gamma-HCH transport system permease protein
MEYLARLGRPPLYVISEIFALYRLLARTLYFVVRGKRERGAIVQQMYLIGNRSLFFMTVTMGVIGVILVYQAGLQAQKIVPDMTFLGPTFTKFLIRDLAASIGAIPLATRVGAGMAAEIGSMVVTDQVDALRMTGADPVDYLVVPRFIAAVVIGMWAAEAVFQVQPATFASLSLVHVGDVIVGLFKCVVYGAAIAIVSTHRGLVAHGGSEGVGAATTTAVVHSSLAIIVLNFFISTASMWVLPP